MRSGDYEKAQCCQQIRRKLIQQDRRRRPNENENRRSIRLIRETLRISSMRFIGYVVSSDPNKLVREFEENAHLEALNERETSSGQL